MIEELLKNKVLIDTTIKKGDERYYYNDIAVPRVTNILSMMLHEDYLMQWANVIGLYKRQKYKETIQKSADIGTFAHDLVEEYTKTQNYNIAAKHIGSKAIFDQVVNCVESYKLWYDDVFGNNEVEILGIEQKLSCPWFGGTYDMLIKINGKIFLIDFKTSNHVGYKYALQLAAYKYMLNEQGINLDGAIILQLSKKQPLFTEYVLDFSNQLHSQFIDECQECFLSLVYSYFQRINVENKFKIVFN